MMNTSFDGDPSLVFPSKFEQYVVELFKNNRRAFDSMKEKVEKIIASKVMDISCGDVGRMEEMSMEDFMKFCDILSGKASIVDMVEVHDDERMVIDDKVAADVVDIEKMGQEGDDTFVALLKGGDDSLLKEDVDVSNKVISNEVQPKISYANMVNKQDKAIKECISSLASLPEPIIRGEKIIIDIPDKVYDDCIARASNDLIGRIQYKKGDKPYLLKDVKGKLQSLWNLKGEWKLAPIGRGFFYCRFASEEDKLLAWAKGMIRLNPGFFKLMKWSPNFNPYNYQSTLVNVWIKIFGLSGELFQPEVMLRVAKGVGTPISIDKTSANFELAHFARVLVEVDVSQNLPNTITTRIKGVEHEIVIEYENLPQFCDHCSLLGHNKFDCRKLRKSIDERREREANRNVPSRARSRSRTKQVFVRKDREEKIAQKVDEQWMTIKNLKRKGASREDNTRGNIHISNTFDCLGGNNNIVDYNVVDGEIHAVDNNVDIDDGDRNIDRNSDDDDVDENIIIEDNVDKFVCKENDDGNMVMDETMVNNTNLNPMLEDSNSRNCVLKPLWGDEVDTEGGANENQICGNNEGDVEISPISSRSNRKKQNKKKNNGISMGPHTNTRSKSK